MAMNPKRNCIVRSMRSMLVLICAATIVPGDALADLAYQPRAMAQASTGAVIPPEQLDSLVAPIALYPDPLLAQVLAASTYPLEIMQLQQWLARHPGLKDQALADAVAKENWDASIQALAALPDVVKRLADDIQWTTDLGNAFLAQESDVMEAVQRMRGRAVEKNSLKSTEQQTVETKVIESKTVYVIQPANPEVIYVPSYNPVVVWGPPLYPYYPYPPIWYPPPGYYAAGLAISFGVGVAMGFWWGGGWGWGCGWGGNNRITINNNNNFNRNVNRGGNRGNLGGGDRASNLPARGGGGNERWQHRPEHRGGAPYRDRTTADRFGGTTRGDSLANRQANARQQLGRQGGNVASNRPAGGAGAGNRPGGGAGVSNRPAGGVGAGTRPGGGATTGNRPTGGGADRVGNRDLSRSNPTGGNRNGFGGGSSGYNGSSARASSNRGSASAASQGGGAARSGGGGGGGRRR